MTKAKALLSGAVCGGAPPTKPTRDN